MRPCLGIASLKVDMDGEPPGPTPCSRRAETEAMLGLNPQSHIFGREYSDNPEEHHDCHGYVEADKRNHHQKHRLAAHSSREPVHVRGSQIVMNTTTIAAAHHARIASELVITAFQRTTSVSKWVQLAFRSLGNGSDNPSSRQVRPFIPPPHHRLLFESVPRTRLMSAPSLERIRIIGVCIMSQVLKAVIDDMPYGHGWIPASYSGVTLSEGSHTRPKPQRRWGYSTQHMGMQKIAALPNERIMGGAVFDFDVPLTFHIRMRALKPIHGQLS